MEDKEDLDRKLTVARKKLDEQTDQSKKLADLNSELRQLFEQERKATEEEFEKLYEDNEQVQKNHERKLAIITSKLVVLVSAFSLGKDLPVDRDNTSIDELISKLQDIAH